MSGKGKGEGMECRVIVRIKCSTLRCFGHIETIPESEKTNNVRIAYDPSRNACSIHKVHKDFME